MRERFRRNESGIALVTVMLVMLLASGLMAGMYAAVVSDQRSHGLDRDQSRAYAAAHAGLEKLTTQLAQLFATDFSPSGTQLTAASATPPAIPGFTYVAPGGGPGYVVSFNADSSGNPIPSPSNDITTGPFAGFKGLITPYTLTVTARSSGGSEVRLRREVQTVAVPVFQFGVFGERSLSFHAGTAFDFGGRVHTNENLFLAHNSGSLYFRDKITVVGEVVRAVLENGASTSSSYPGNVMIPQVIGSTYRNLTATEGSVNGLPGLSGTQPISGWENLSKVTYQTNIRNTLTGAKRLDLPLVSQGAAPIDLIRRPRLDVADNPAVFGQRYFAQASLRILLSDRDTDITGLPTVTADAPIPLDGSWNPAGLPPVALSVGTHTATVSSTGGTGSSSTGTLTISGGTPNWLRIGGVATMPAITFGTVTVSGCTGMTATTLTGCTTSGNPPTNTNAAAALSLDSSIGGGSVLLRTSGTAASGTNPNRTVPVVSTRGLTLGSRVVWSGNTPLTCTGYTSTQLTGCYWSSTPSTTAPLRTNYLSAAGQSLLGGFIKIERQTTVGATTVWVDVTNEILSLGFAAPNQEGTSGTCADPTPNAVIRIQRLRDNGTPTAACAYGGTLLATDFWPNALFDAREASTRNLPTTGTNSNPMLGGVMNYITLDVGNLKRWLSGAIGTTGNQTLNQNGFIIYFSDRRGNHDWDAPNDPETGEYGNENNLNMAAGGNPADQVPAAATLDQGEDRNEDGQLQTYGQRVETTVAGVVPTGAPGSGIYSDDSTPFMQLSITTANNELPTARINKQVLFRRALKITNGCIGVSGTTPGCNAANGVNNLPDSGLTIASENGVYVQGNFNATSASANVEPNRPAAVIADSIVILSNNWLDVRSFNSPNDMGGRPATDTGYRFAMIAGKSVPFLRPTWATQTNWGSDGGVHNFLRMLEDWGGGGNTVYYRGSMVSLYTARQFTGIFRDHDNVYDFPERSFAFDTDFLDPTKLPPGTPMFRDVNTLRFRQILRPNQ